MPLPDVVILLLMNWVPVDQLAEIASLALLTLLAENVPELPKANIAIDDSLPWTFSTVSPTKLNVFSEP